MSNLNQVNVYHSKEEQMALLSSVMYFDGIVFDTDKTLGENLEYMRDNKPKEWEKMLDKCGDDADGVANAILADPELRDLKVVDCTRTHADYKGPVNACFVNENAKEAIFAFRGTNKLEWMDNAEALANVSSPNQQEALAYVNKIIEEYALVENEYAIDVTGHSKGGNKAMYVTLEKPYIRRCYAFDGQGFSDEYISESADKIAERGGKIVNYAAENDPVHPCGNMIGTMKWLESEHTGLNAHRTSAFMHFDENNKMCFNAETEQSEFSKTLNQITQDMMKEPQAEKEKYFDGIMSIMQAVRAYEGLYEGQEMPDLETMYKDLGQNKENIDAAIDYIQQGKYFEDDKKMEVVLNFLKSSGGDNIHGVVFGGIGTWEKLVNQDGNIADKATDVIDGAQYVSGVVVDQRQESADNLVNVTQELVGGIVDGAQGFADQAVDGAQGIVGGVVDGAQDFGGKAVDGLQGLFDEDGIVSKSIENVQEWTGDAVDTVQEWTGDAVDTVQEWTGDAVDTVQEWTGDAVDTVQEWTGDAVDTVQEWTGDAVDTVKEWTGDTVDTVKEWTGGAVDTVQEWTGDTVDAVKEWTGNAVDTFNGVGENIQELFDGSKSEVIAEASMGATAMLEGDKSKEALAPYSKVPGNKFMSMADYKKEIMEKRAEKASTEMSENTQARRKKTVNDIQW